MRALALLVSSLLGSCIFLPRVVEAAAPAVELVADAPWLAPTSTLEFRFARPIVAHEDLGVPVAAGPFTLEPKVPGTFTWLSRSSGVFVPTGPWPLAAKFTVAVSKELKTADGQPLGETLRVELVTPNFENTAVHGVGNGTEIKAMPEMLLAYNLAVDLAGAAGHIRFVNSEGRAISAQVRHATNRDYFPLPPEKEDWQVRWEESRNPTVDLGWREPGPPIMKPSQLMITPSEPLSPGGIWSLEVKAGLRSQDGRHQDSRGVKIPLGAVETFELKTVEASSYVNTGRSLVLRFSDRLAPDITAGTVAKFLRVEPAVANFRAEESYDTLTLRGDFERGREYVLHLEPGVVSAEGVPLAGERLRPFRFAPVAPRVYLPEFTTHQVRGGLRKFEVASVNLRSLKVTARRVPATGVPRAVEAFEKYTKEEFNETEPYQPLAADAIPGEVIHERVIELPPGALDLRQETTLNWDEILGAGAGGPVFLTVTGEPLPEAGGRAVEAQALVQVTDIGILWKRHEGGVRVMAFSIAKGTSTPKARIAIYDEEYREMGRATTDPTGTATLPLKGPPGWLVVTMGGDVHAMRLGQLAVELPMAAFRLPISYGGWDAPSAREQQVSGLIFTDRPLYRPGELVQVKGLLRVLGEAGLAVGESFKARLTLRDPRWEEADSVEVETDERGAFDAEIQLPTSPHGAYRIELQLVDAPGARGGGDIRASFVVADYQPNAFQVEMDLPERIAPGAAVSAAARANYFFGSPVREATARWTLQYSRETFAPEGFSEWRFGSEEQGESAMLTLQGAGDLAKPEGLAIQPQLPPAEGAPHAGVLTLEITDINQQTVTEARTFRRDASEFYLGVAVPEGIVHRAGEVVTAAVVAVGTDGAPLPGLVDVQAELIRIHHDTVRVQGAGKAISFRTETREERVAQAAGRSVKVEQRGGQWQAAEWTSATFKPPQAGEYRLRVTAKDAGGRAVASERDVYVVGPEALAWDYRNPAQIELVVDRAEYRPGETARILVKSPISGDAIVTVERGESVLRTMRVRLEGNAPAVEIPLTASDAPNVFVSVVLIRGLEQSTRKVKTPEYRYGAAMLRVRDPQAHLQVAVRPARPHVEPDEELETEITVTDGADRPVADAEVTFFAVDDGVLALTGYERPMPGAIFEEPVPLGVQTGLSLYRLLPEDPAALVFANKGYLIGGGGLEGPGLKLRRDFPGTAAWFPALRTDAAGKVRVRFRAPDALTRYRLVAVAHAAENLFGSGESAFAINKPLMLLPALGQFANIGDDLIARAVLRNESGADGVVEVSLELDSTAEAGATTARIELRNGEARAVDFPLRLRRTGSAEWNWSARMELPGRVLDDRVVSALTIGSPAPLLRETYLTELSAPSSDLLAGVNPQLLEGSGVVATSLSNTRLSSLRESVTQLWEYPYGCAEQITSTLIPWALFTELRPVLPEFVKTEDEVAEAIEGGLDKLFAQQGESGGISMWPGDGEPSTFLTAYAAIACSLVQARDVALPDGHEKLLEFLSEGLRETATMRGEPHLGDAALALYALAVSGKAEPAYHEALYQRRAELSHESRALLAAAIVEARGPAKMAEVLLNTRTPAPESPSWFGGAARERAIQLLAWSRFKPKDPEVARLVKELLGHRKSGHWGTTQGNAWALLALTRYYVSVERSASAVVSGSLVRAGEPAAFQVTKKQPAAVFSFPFAPDAPLGTLAVKNPAKRLLFGETRFTVRPPVAAQPRQDRGYAVSRSYRKLAPDGTLADAVGLKVGDRVLVTLRVETSRPGHFLAIDDPLPAILEAVNPAFKSRAIAGQADAVEWAADHREIRTDRVVYFCDHLPAGAFTFQYLARVRSAGTVTAGATKVEEMYRPERFGLGENMQLVALPADVK